jgi:hypothetical protein
MQGTVVWRTVFWHWSQRESNPLPLTPMPEHCPPHHGALHINKNKLRINMRSIVNIAALNHISLNFEVFISDFDYFTYFDLKKISKYKARQSRNRTHSLNPLHTQCQNTIRYSTVLCINERLTN